MAAAVDRERHTFGRSRIRNPNCRRRGCPPGQANGVPPRAPLPRVANTRIRPLPVDRTSPARSPMSWSNWPVDLTMPSNLLPRGGHHSDADTPGRRALPAEVIRTAPYDLDRLAQEGTDHALPVVLTGAALVGVLRLAAVTPARVSAPDRPGVILTNMHR